MIYEAKFRWAIVSIVSAIAALVYLSFSNPKTPNAPEPETDAEAVEAGATSPKHMRAQRVANKVTQEEETDGTAETDEGGESAETPEPESPMSEEERKADEEEKLVDTFDALTDKWTEDSEKEVTMDDVRKFAECFAKVPPERKDECIHRALNLIPDSNVMLLAGVLMDKSQDQEIVETVFNDILNRDEDVKTPILRQILKDKSHPCWADAAWILDVTGEVVPEEGKQNE